MGAAEAAQLARLAAHLAVDLHRLNAGRHLVLRATCRRLEATAARCITAIIPATPPISGVTFSAGGHPSPERDTVGLEKRGSEILAARDSIEQRERSRTACMTSLLARLSVRLCATARLSYEQPLTPPTPLRNIQVTAESRGICNYKISMFGFLARLGPCTCTAAPSGFGHSAIDVRACFACSAVRSLSALA